MVLADSIGQKTFASALIHKIKIMNTTFSSLKGIFVFALVATFALTSCNRDTEGCTDPAAENYDADADTDDGTCSYAVVAPDTYVFTDADGNNTVSYSGQHQRLNMLSEMSSYLKTANEEGVAVDADVLKNMYANENHTWDDEEGLGMTGSSKQLKNKTVGGDTEFTNIFETWMDEVAAASDGSGAGSAGVAGGVLSTTNPAKQYLQSAQGQEWTQLIEKGLMGACFYYNISVVYREAIKWMLTTLHLKIPRMASFTQKWSTTGMKATVTSQRQWITQLQALTVSGVSTQMVAKTFCRVRQRFLQPSASDELRFQQTI